MNQEIKNNNSEAPMVLTQRGRIAKRLAGVLLAGSAVFGATQLGNADKPSFHGETTIEINGDTTTVTDIAVNVDGAENGKIRETVDEIVKQNPDVFQDRGEGKTRAFVESEDIGKDVTIPESVSN